MRYHYAPTEMVEVWKDWLYQVWSGYEEADIAHLPINSLLDIQIRGIKHIFTKDSCKNVYKHIIHNNSKNVKYQNVYYQMSDWLIIWSNIMEFYLAIKWNEIIMHDMNNSGKYAE